LLEQVLLEQLLIEILLFQQWALHLILSKKKLPELFFKQLLQAQNSLEKVLLSQLLIRTIVSITKVA
jgi:hypothetical protein